MYATTVPASVLSGQPSRSEMTKRIENWCPNRCSVAYYCNGSTSEVAQQKQLTAYLQEELALSKQQNETRLMEVKHAEMTVERLEKANSKLRENFKRIAKFEDLVITCLDKELKVEEKENEKPREVYRKKNKRNKVQSSKADQQEKSKDNKDIMTDFDNLFLE